MFAKGLRQGNTLITRLKVEEIIIYDKDEILEKYNFKYKDGEGIKDGYHNTEMQIFTDKDCIDNESYRLPIIF